MKNYFKILSGAVALCLLAAVGCTEVDDSLGLNLVPGNQSMKLRMATITGSVDTYTVRTDSMATNSLGLAIFGYRNNNLVGKTVAGSYMQYLPASFDSTYFFGNKPIADSAFLNITISEVSAEKSAQYPFGFGPEQVFGIYKSNTLFKIDSTFYPGFDIQRYIDPQPLFTFKHRGTALEAKNFKLDYTKGSAGDKFLQELISADTMTLSPYAPDTTFLTKYKGFYIAPISTGTSDAAIYGFQMSSYGSMIASFSLWGHNYKSKESDVNDPKQIKDTLEHHFFLMDDSRYWKMTAFATVKHDYTGSLADNYITKSIADTAKNAPSQKLTFVQSMGGLGTFVRFKDELAQKINALKTLDGVEYSNLVFNKAMMYLYVRNEDRTIPFALDAAPSRIGMYYKFNSRIPTGAPDYNYEYEANYQTQLPYGGYLNREKGRYEMDITTYLQRLLAEYEKQDGVTKKGVQRGVIFAPDFANGAGSYYYYYDQVALDGCVNGIVEQGHMEPQFELTFTLIK